MFLVGTGLIGKTLIKQIAKHKEYLRATRSLEISIAGISNSRKMIFDADGISLNRYAEHLEKGEPADMVQFVQSMIGMNLPQSIFVDCTSNEVVVKHYAEIMENSISIVTPNKIANSESYKSYLNLRAISKKRNVRFLYETNVGAGLPVINTLTDLLNSGDEIRRIEAVLSGTLSFIFNNYNEGVEFSDIVKQAQEKGFTEPDPRVDLSGKDVARKLLILARETGLKIEMKDIKIEGILPASCLKAATVPAFFVELKKNNHLFEARRAKAARANKVLRFIASLDKGKAKISLQEVDSSHPFYNLL